MNYKTTIAFILLLAASQVGFSQVADTLDLGEIVVTVSKTETGERETTKPVTVIGRQEIERNAGSSISELLNQQNGIQINGAVSSPGKDKSVYLRGASTQYTLILIDGFPVSDPSGEGGAFDLRLIPLENVERIEIVKGSMSTLYGSDAIAGVINIITRKSSDEKIKFNAKTAYGSFNTNELSLGANGRSGIMGYSVNLSRDFTEGITEAEPGQNSGFNKDGFERRAISTRISLDAFKGFTVTPFLNYSDYDGDYDAGAFADGDNRYEASLLNTGARVNYETGDLKLKHATTFTQTERKFTDDFGVFNPSASLLNSDLFGMYNKFESFRFLAGFNVQDLNFELDGIDEGSHILSPYLTAYFESGLGLNGELGVRLNDHSEYGSNWTFNVAPVYNVNEQVKVLASVSSGFKAPTLNELFGPFGANTNLKPQRSLTFDTGIEFSSSDMKFSGSVIYFQRKIDDLISYDSNLGYINVNEQNDSGIEVKIGYSLPLTQAEIFYNFLDGAITQNGEETDNLIRRPDHSFGLKISQSVTEELRVNLFGKYVGEREDVFFNTNNFMNESVTLDSYVLVDLDIQYKFLNDKLDLFASVNNLLNADYTEVYGFNTPGIHYKAGLRFSF